MIAAKKKRMPGFKFALNGLLHTIKNEKNFRIHLIIVLTVVIAGLYFNVTTTEWLLLFASIGIVLMSELINTSIELLVDLVSPESNEKAGLIKDIAAAAVLTAALIAIIIGLIIFIPYVI